MRWWTALKGAAHYAAAHLAGNICGPDDADDRLNWCANCAELTRAKVITAIGHRRYWTCGPEFDEVDGEHCGCVVAAEADVEEVRPTTLTVDGIPVVPAGRLWIADGEHSGCPRGYFGPVVRTNSAGSRGG